MGNFVPRKVRMPAARRMPYGYSICLLDQARARFLVALARAAFDPTQFCLAEDLREGETLVPRDRYLIKALERP